MVQNSKYSKLDLSDSSDMSNEVEKEENIELMGEDKILDSMTDCVKRLSDMSENIGVEINEQKGLFEKTTENLSVFNERFTKIYKKIDSLLITKKGRYFIIFGLLLILGVLLSLIFK
ncbi:hypothetical protein MHBO_002639 [Bonamia ostreae]|uniref:t-SNARE coiled-coil homology domain-containing protein n=1 Tax=Bonamia ostreae TaxID=126728 RepID=A0ABV2AMZ3_9EUKA